MPRPSWKGYLRLSLVSVPVEAINAIAAEEAEVTLHQLHATCHSRIRYQKVCPIHGEVPNDEIVLGYEREKGQYVVVEKDEVKDIKGKAEKAIQIDTFVSPDSIDPMQFEGRAYYLLPDGPIGQKPYAVLLRALAANGYVGIGQAALFGRQRLVAVRAMKDMLCLEMLYFPHQVRSPESIAPDVPRVEVSKEELRLATTLIEATTSDQFDMAKYEDEYTAKLKRLIESKMEEEPSVSSPAEKELPLINLMDALRRSVAQQNRAKGSGAKKTAASKPTPAHRRPSGNRRAS
ncbi:MAG TPA: Ku protein [Pirellulales bacterium]|jgi:DNA end-binding protein Ku|nr:Ku protein [Pirellulales bacterium]